MECPKCGSTNVARGRRPNGNDICGSCHHVWPSKETNQKPETKVWREFKFEMVKAIPHSGVDIIWDGDFGKQFVIGDYHVIEIGAVLELESAIEHQGRAFKAAVESVVKLKAERGEMKREIEYLRAEMAKAALEKRTRV